MVDADDVPDCQVIQSHLQTLDLIGQDDDAHEETKLNPQQESAAVQ